MSFVRRLKSSLERLGGRRFDDANMDQEVRFHIEMQAAELVRQGLSEDEAWRQAKLRFGDVERVKEECREVFAVRWIEDILRDIQYGWRTLVQNRVFTVVAVLTLALGIGANTAIFSVVNSVLLESLPFRESERLVMVWEENPAEETVRQRVAPANFLEWDRESRSFESMGYIVNWTSATRSLMMRTGDRSIRVRARYASSGLFETLGSAPLLGRTFSADEDFTPGAQTVVLSHAFWQRQFAGDPGILGATIEVGEPFTVEGVKPGQGSRLREPHERVGETFTVVGVMPPEFRVPDGTDFWMSSSLFLPAPRLEPRGWHALWVLGRLKPGVTPEMAQKELSLIQQQIHRQHPDERRVADAVRVVPYRDEVIGTSTRPALVVLLGAVGFVLLIACANVASLTLARSSGRRREFAIRASLGAGRTRVVRQLLTESLLLSLLGAAVGILMAHWGIDVIMTLRPDDSFVSINELRSDYFADVSLDWKVLGFTLALSVATGVGFGLIPAVQTARMDVNSVMKEEGRGGTASRAARRFGDAIIVGEVALAFVLLIGAGQMLLTFLRMQQRDPGLNPDSVLCAEIDLGVAMQRYSGDGPDITDAMTEKVRGLPGVVSVSTAGQYPLRDSGWVAPVYLENRQSDEMPQSDINVVAPAMFETLGIPLLRGRDFTRYDNADAPHVAVVNEEFVRRHFPNSEVLGQRIRLRPFQPWSEIVGIVGDTRNHRLSGQVEPIVYFPWRQSIWTGEDLGPILIVRTVGDPLMLVTALRVELEGESNPEILKNFRTVDGILTSTSSRERFQTLLLGFFTAVAVLLAAVGVYGVIAYSTAQRFGEIGIRMALGAPTHAIGRMILRRGFVLGLIGAVIGLGASVVLSRAISSRLYGVAQPDVMMYAAAVTFLIAVVLAASFLPARSAMKVEPVSALRHM